MLIDSEAFFSNLLSSRAIAQRGLYQSGFTCSKLTIETLEQGVKYVQS